MTHSPAPDTCLVFLVRHAATLNNLANPPMLQGHASNVGLSDQGYGQAERTARLLADQPIDLAFSSPLLRARQTAQIICQPHQLTPTPIQDLREVDVGHWEGRSWDEIQRSEPEAYQRFITDPATNGYAGGENLEVLRQRVMPAVQDLMARHLGSLLLVVGHNVVNRVLLATWMHIPLSLARGIHQNNCGVNVLRYRNDQVTVLTANAAFHL